MSQPAPELILDAELVDPGQPMPPPGIFHGIALMRYRVLRVIEGEYKHSETHVGHAQANPKDPTFQQGARHRLYLTSAFPEHVSVLGVEQSSPGQVFFCLRLEPLTLS